MTPQHFLVPFLLLASMVCLHANHVIVISCDGMRPDAVAKLGEKGLPNLHRLMKEGAYTGNARTDKDYTVTLPNHTCMITGRGVKGEAGHNWTSNGTPKLGEFLHKNKKAYLCSMFDVVHDHGLKTAVFASKKKFVLYDISYNERFGEPDTVGADNGRDKIDDYEFEEDSAKLIARYLVKMTRAPYHLSFIHLRDPDTAGHAHGWDLTDDSKYLRALAKCDMLIGQLLTLIEGDDRLRDRTWMIVTADHGGRLETKTHTAAEQPLNYTIPFFVWGPGVSKGADLYTINAETRKDPGEVNPPYGADDLPPIRNGDGGNLALKLLGLPQIKGSTINAKGDLHVAPRIDP